jgi:hypothetical protein
VSLGPADAGSGLAEVFSALESLGIRFHVGGSYASSLHGHPRQTLDADLVVDLPEKLVRPLADRLRDHFYLDEERMLHAVRKATSFNAIHLASGFKVDFFVKGLAEFDELELQRSVEAELPQGGERKVPVKSAEDTLLRKLQWFVDGGQVSDRQWNDILGIVRVQGDRLDRAYVEEWGERLGVGEVLRRDYREGAPS